MSRYVNVTVAAGEAEVVAGALLAHYAAQATNVSDHVGREDRLMHEARAELAEAERMLDVFGWERGGRVRPAELVGPEATVGAVLRLALDDAHEALGEQLAGYHRGAAELEAVLTALERLRAVVGHFAAFEREHAL
jgi:hypothetical protein